MFNVEILTKSFFYIIVVFKRVVYKEN